MIRGKHALVQLDDPDLVSDIRAEAISEALGCGYSNVGHSRHPFVFGGNAEVLQFNDHLQGVVYVTADLTGPPADTFADYELMICNRENDPWAPHIISQLAPYALKAYLGDGDTVEIGPSATSGCLISGLILKTYAVFKMYGASYELRLCVGITQDELEFKLEHGSEALLALLKQRGVYPYTDFTRTSVLSSPRD